VKVHIKAVLRKNPCLQSHASGDLGDEQRMSATDNHRRHAATVAREASNATGQGPVNNIVYGLEAAFQGADLNGTFAFHGPITFVGGGANVATFVAHERLDWLGTVRPRVGFLVTPQALLYATGGLACGGGSVDQNISYVSPAVQFPSSTSFTKLGWTAGGGLEWKLASSN
jgi:opacity protein-like surface antigen